MTLTETLAALRSATTGSADLDLMVGKALGVVPANARFMYDSDDTWTCPTIGGVLIRYTRSLDAIVGEIRSRNIGIILVCLGALQTVMLSDAPHTECGAPVYHTVIEIAACIALIEMLPTTPAAP